MWTRGRRQQKEIGRGARCRVRARLFRLVLSRFEAGQIWIHIRWVIWLLAILQRLSISGWAWLSRLDARQIAPGPRSLPNQADCRGEDEMNETRQKASVRALNLWWNHFGNLSPCWLRIYVWTTSCVGEAGNSGDFRTKNVPSLERFFFKTSTVFSCSLTVTTKYFYLAFRGRMNTIRAKFFLPLHLLQKHIVLIYCSSCAFVAKYEANMQKWCISYLWQVLSCPSTKKF